MRPTKYLGKGWVFRLPEPYVATCPAVLSVASPSELFEYFFTKDQDDVEEFVERLSFRLGHYLKKKDGYGDVCMPEPGPGGVKDLIRETLLQERAAIREFINSQVDHYLAFDRVVFGQFLNLTDFLLEEIDINV
jgi:hypothetical protein